MEKQNNNKLYIIISVCLVAVIALLLVLIFAGGKDPNNESSADISINDEVSDTASDTDISESEVSEEMSEEVSEDVSEEFSEPEESAPVEHIHDYADTWVSNETDHWKECECGEKTDIASHTYGEWTTTKEATEETEGSKYHACTACGYKETVTIPALEHTHKYSDAWSNNETDHWHECKCGDKADVASHTYSEWTTTKEATEETEGSKYHTCTTCSYKETVNIPVLSHTHSFGNWKNNATSHWKECKCGDKSELSSHTYGEWTTTKEATCTTTGTKKHTCTACGYSETAIIPVIAHTYGDWKSNATSHWKECKCGDKSSLSTHTYNAWTATKEATCTEMGIKKHTCTACGYSETATIPVIAHTYGDWKKDDTNHWKECTECGNKANKENHTYTSVVTPPTETEKGYTTHTCNKCGYSYVDSYVEPNYSGLAYRINDDGVTCTIIGIGTCKDSDLKIPTSICGYKVTIIGRFAFAECAQLTGVTIPDSVTTIDDYAFQCCNNLVEAITGNGVTKIGQDAFFRCGSLSNVTLGNNVQFIDGGAFNDCDSLKNISIPNNVTVIERGVFYNCNNLTNITIPDSVTTLGDAVFAECTKLTRVTIGNGLKTISYGTFANCYNLTDIVFGSNVTTIGTGAFYTCKSLTSITIPDSVTEIGSSAFKYCYNLTEVTIGNGVKTIGAHAFEECTKLTNVTFGNSITEIGGQVFLLCQQLDNVVIPDSVITIGDDAFSQCTHMTKLVIGKNVKTIGNFAFQGCYQLTSLVIPDSVTKIGDGAFKFCSSLTTLTIGNSVKKIGDYTFGHCYKLTSVTIGNNVTSIGDYAFDYCYALDNITLPKSLTYVGCHAFRESENITTVITNVYYGGSEEDWGKISFEEGNIYLTNAKIHYNSQSKFSTFRGAVFIHVILTIVDKRKLWNIILSAIFLYIKYRSTVWKLRITSYP